MCCCERTAIVVKYKRKWKSKICKYSKMRGEQLPLEVLDRRRGGESATYLTLDASFGIAGVHVIY
jgi:hypothetical protein